MQGNKLFHTLVSQLIFFLIYDHGDLCFLMCKSLISAIHGKHTFFSFFKHCLKYKLKAKIVYFFDFKKANETSEN